MTWNGLPTRASRIPGPRAFPRAPRAFPERRDGRAFAREVGLHIASYRHEHGLTIDDLARATGMRRSMIILVESGQVRLSLATLAKITAVTSIEFHLDIRRGTAVITGRGRRS